MLQKISDKIGYKEKILGGRDVRSYIFTQEFMNKFNVYLLDNKITKIHFWFELQSNLDNSVKYLYNLLELGKQ